MGAPTKVKINCTINYNLYVSSEKSKMAPLPKGGWENRRF